MWLTVQKMRDGKPYQDEFIMSGQEVFEDGWKFRLNASSPDSAYLYVANEGPGPGDTRSLHLLFPTPSINGGSASLTPGAPMQSGRTCSPDQGTERFWLVASQHPVVEFEAVKGVVNPQDQGLVSDAAQRAAILALLTRGRNRRPSVEKDGDRKHTILRSADPILVHSMTFEHH